jgi:hypothetical protein
LKLFDQTPDAWICLKPWAKKRDEFQRRAGFVLLACLAGYDRTAGDEKFIRRLPLIEQGALEERNLVN